MFISIIKTNPKDNFLMNILFITDAEANPLSGGIERVTYNLAESFRKLDFNVLCVTSEYDFKLLFSQQKFDFVISNAIKKQSLRNLLPHIFSLTKHTDTKFIVCYHSMPGYEFHSINKGIKFLKGLGLSFIVQKIISNKLKNVLFSDCVVLLSNRYIPVCQNLIQNTSHPFFAIANSLGLKEIATQEILLEKKDEVLIVARFDESSKRISLALKIWQKIEESNDFNNWILRIVGSGGADEKTIKKLANKLQLKNISFEGRQNPLEYYKKASIFMMTSAYEGFPMTIGEAQQNGCVPVAFNSFAAIYDIIEHNQNGIIVNNNDIEEYVGTLKKLMLHKEKRDFLAINGLKSCERYTEEVIVNNWLSLFNNLKNYN